MKNNSQAVILRETSAHNLENAALAVNQPPRYKALIPPVMCGHVGRRLGRHVIILCCWVSLVEAQTDTYTVRSYDPRIQHGIDLVYNLQFESADRYFEEIIIADPENPLGYFFLAMVTWWRVLIDLENRSHDQVFYKLLDQCIAVCDRRLKSSPRDFDAVLFKAGSIGFRGRLRGNRGQYLRAARDGLKCMPLLKTSQELEPENKDILFGQGIYNYFIEVIPREYPVVRPITWLLPKGKREIGLEQLRQVAAEGRYAATEALYFLAQIHRLFELDKQTSLRYIEQLHERYPQNSIFHRSTARNRVETGRWSQGAAAYRDVLRRSETGQVGYHIYGEVEARYYLGQHAWLRRRYEEAVSQLEKAEQLAASQSRKSMRKYRTLCLLLMGKIDDIRGERQQALERYAQVRSLPNYGTSHKQANRYSEDPYQEFR